MRTRILALDPALTVVLSQEVLDGQLLNRVLIGQLDSWLAAETVRRRLQARGVAGLVRKVTEQPQIALATPPAGPPTTP